MPAIARARNVAALPLILVLILLTTLFAITPPAEAMTRAHRISNAFQIVRAQQGDAYRYGAAGPNAFDCSGLVYYSFRRAGFTGVPRTSDAQARHARRIKRANMRRGDLVFIHSRGNVYHVGVFAGRHNGRRTIIHAPNSRRRVNRDPIWTNSWFPGTLR